MPRSISAEIDIDAPVDRVWDILVDLASYPAWNPFTTHVESTLRVGDPARLTVQMRPDKEIVQVETVSAFEPGHKLCWGMKLLGRRILAANRCQVVTALDRGRTRYYTEDAFRGALVPLVHRLYGADIQRGFTGIARALKARAEA